MMQLVLDFAASLCSFCFLMFVLFGVYICVEAYHYQCCLGPALERDLGFREGAVYLQVGRSVHSAVAIEEVTEGGTFETAGLRAGDVLPDRSHTDLFKLLHRHRGRVAELAVVDGGEGPPFYMRPRRVVRFAVPPRGQNP
jgi:hypothetical protein